MHSDPAMGVGDAPASSAAHHCRLRLHRDRQRVTTLTRDRDHAQPGKPDQQVASVAVATLTTTRSRLIHVEVLAIRRGRSPLILKGLDPYPASPSASARRPHPTLNGEEPNKETEDLVEEMGTRSYVDPASTVTIHART